MTSSAPQVPIRVDPETGVWMTDGLPMIYLPRHFYVNHHDTYAKALGREAHAKLLYEPGYASAWQWCESESAKHGLRGTDVFRHYMKRISQRGWGQFTVEALDEATGVCRLLLDHSVYVCHHGKKPGECLCYAFAGWFPGALEWAGRDSGKDWRLTASETQCAAAGEHDHCLFEIRTRDGA